MKMQTAGERVAVIASQAANSAPLGEGILVCFIVHCWLPSRYGQAQTELIVNFDPG